MFLLYPRCVLIKLRSKQSSISPPTCLKSPLTPWMLPPARAPTVFSSTYVIFMSPFGICICRVNIDEHPSRLYTNPVCVPNSFQQKIKLRMDLRTRLAIQSDGQPVNNIFRMKIYKKQKDTYESFENSDQLLKPAHMASPDRPSAKWTRRSVS